ncbi:hypothetical protein DE146DRAFT_203 [Phaeosphaeria sp. MPI-PUGE-AT-0046c]|nr:hypothetical protein DE146DRAFT_203 [Phaeosphaeria sp. MPI-PUGE-AT-0046c]
MAWLLPLLLCSFLSYRVRGWKLDASCTQMGVGDHIRDGMAGAFDMVDSAHRRLTATPRAADTDELIGHLFAKEGQKSSEVDMWKTQSLFENINLYYRNELTADQEPDWKNIVVFCNLDRFQKVQGRINVYRDKTSGILYSYSQQSCKGASDWVALAVTSNPMDKNIDGMVEENRKPTQLQLCPWFIDWIKNKEYKFHRDVRRTNIGQHVIKAAESSKYGFRQIDVFSLLDKVLLHEMTHGRSIFTTKWDKKVKEGLMDVTDPSFLGFGLPAYGWKRAVSLAKKGEDLGKRRAADNNAETIALFASACLLLDQTDKPRKVDAKGNVIPRT